jgi:hypothetical protein
MEALVKMTATSSTSEWKPFKKSWIARFQELAYVHVLATGILNGEISQYS